MARVKPIDKMPPNLRLSDDLIDLMKDFSLSSAQAIGGAWEIPLFAPANAFDETMESRLSDRKLKPLPPDPFRHQNSAIARPVSRSLKAIGGDRHSRIVRSIRGGRPHRGRKDDQGASATRRHSEHGGRIPPRCLHAGDQTAGSAG